MKRLVTAGEIRDMYFSGRRVLVLPPGAIVTPGARDLIYAFNFEVRVGGDAADAGAVAQGECARDAVPEGEGLRDTVTPGEGLRDAVTRVVDSVLASASADDRRRVIDAVVEELSAKTRG